MSYNYNNYASRRSDAYRAQNNINDIVARYRPFFDAEGIRALTDGRKTRADDRAIERAISNAIDYNPGNYREVHQVANRLRSYLDDLDGTGGTEYNLGTFGAGSCWPTDDRYGYEFSDRYNQWINYFQAPDVDYGWGNDDYYGYDRGWDNDDNNRNANIFIGAAAGLFLGGLFGSWFD